MRQPVTRRYKAGQGYPSHPARPKTRRSGRFVRRISGRYAQPLVRNDCPWCGREVELRQWKGDDSVALEVAALAEKLQRCIVRDPELDCLDVDRSVGESPYRAAGLVGEFSDPVATDL